mmetsp:Transcript_5220/g.8758  ORF Transcript_5220/g.8758 Transcript_5220/m.8758 type:complete len:339 (+) Transcript_5220:30-1046(+)
MMQHSPPQQPPDDHHIHWLWFLGYVLLYLLCIFFPALVAESYWNVIFFPLVFLTALIVYLVYNTYIRHNVRYSHMYFADLFRGFSHSFFGGGFFALLTELWVTTVFLLIVLLIFGPSRALTAIQNESFADEAASYTCNNVGVHLYLAFTSFCVAGFIEEASKAYLLQYVTKLYLPHTIHLRPVHQDYHRFVWLGLCVGLGFGSVEGVLYVCLYGATAGFAGQFILWLIRAFIAIPFHTITGFLWGVHLSKRECHKVPQYTWLKMGYQQILLHGLYDFIEMEIALDLVCASATTWLQILLSIGIAIAYTVGSAVFAWYQYRKVLREQENNNDHQLIDGE